MREYDVKTYEVGGTWVVSVNDCWVPGVYVTAEAAVWAAENRSDEEILALAHIYRVDGENRPLTMEDLGNA